MSDSENETTVLGKREREQNVAPAADASMHDDDQSDEDVGPMPIPSDANGPTVKKKRKGEYIISTLALDISLSLLSRELVLPHEKLYLEHLPNADQYYQSFMHRDALNFCVITKCVLNTRLVTYAHSCRRTNFLITTSIDGHLKLWKKQETGIEFVKHFRAHASPIVGVSVSADGQLFASISEDGSAKVFDVVNFGTRGSLAPRYLR